MTHADRIRDMSDEELATLFTGICSARDHIITDKLAQAGVDAELIEFPCGSYQRHLAWLKEEANRNDWV